MSMNFCKNFAVLRRAHGYTQETIAEKCGVSRQAIAKWETGASLPDMYKLVDIAKLFDVSIDDLVCGNCFSGLDALPAIREEMEAMNARLSDEMKVMSSKLDEIKEKFSDDSEDGEALYQYYLDMLDSSYEEEARNWLDVLENYYDVVQEYKESGYEKAWDIIEQQITLGHGPFLDVLSNLIDLACAIGSNYLPVGDKKNTQYLDFIEDVANIMPAWSKILKHEIMLERQEPSRFWDDWDLYQDIGQALLQSKED